MRITKRILGLSVLPLLAAGCASTITNMTPSQIGRNSTGMYPFEVAWDSNMQAVKKDTLKPSVLVGTETYPMQPVPLVKNRWETVVPIPADKDVVHYQYKFDYRYRTIPAPQKDSKLSKVYSIKIKEK